jgi:hypothetical protein
MTDHDIWEHLWALLDGQNAEDVVYVYRIGPDGKPVKPYLVKCEPWLGLLEHLQAHYGGGTFRIMIRRRRNMVLTGTFGIVPIPRGDAFMEP